MVHLRMTALAFMFCTMPQVARADGINYIRSVQLILVRNAGEEPAQVRKSPEAASPVPSAVGFRVFSIGPDQLRDQDTAPDVLVQLAVAQAPQRQIAGSVVSSRSSIAVPAWLSNSDPDIARATTGFGCTPLSYRPTGFLKAKAEMRRARYYSSMSAIACENGIPEGLFDAMIIQESRYDPDAVSPRNARGLIQLMPGTAMELGVDPDDPVENLRGGARYFRKQLDRFGQVHLALAAYNAGPARIRGNSIPAITETQTYVSTILGNWARVAQAGEVTPIYLPPKPPFVRTATISIF